MLDDIAREVNVYDSSVTTGSTPLDIILSEKGLLCQQRGITLSSVADGGAVSLMSPSDIYALFGNLIDNAIEAVEREEDPERRCIFVVVRRAIGHVSIHVENYCSTPVTFVDGLPQTTKDDQTNHGYGTKSIRLITSKYGGAVTMGQVDGVFHANILMPPPEDQSGGTASP